MKARAFISGKPRQLAVEEKEIGALPDDGVLIQNAYTAVSIGTELYCWVHGAEPGHEPEFPRDTGYCSAGTVLEVGKDVTSVKPGDRVAAQGHHASHEIVTGLYYKLPEKVPLKDAALLVMAAIAQHGNRVAKIELGESVVILGCGLVGQLALTLARLSGARPTIAIDLDEFRLEKARARGADLYINASTTEDVPAAVREACIDDGANVVMECTGKPAVYPMAVQMASTAGRVVSLGSPRGTVQSMDFFTDVHLREVAILGAIQPKTPTRDHIYFRWTMDRERSMLLDLMGEGKLPVEDLVTHLAKPEQCQEIYTMLADRPERALGVVFEWDGGLA